MLWNAKYQSLCKQLKIPKEHDKKFKEKEQSNPSTEKTGRQRRNSSRSPGTRRKRTLSGRSLSDYSDIEMDNLKSDQEVTIEDDDHAPRLDEPMEVNNTNHVSNGPSLSAKANLNCSISEVSIELKTELINFVQEKLISRFVLSASELRRLFLMKVTQCPPGHILGTGVSDKLLEETVLQVGGVQLENQWPPNVKEEPIFALPKTGDKLDPARTVLLNWFNKNYKITKKSFTKAVEDETGETMSDNDCKLLLKDYCQAKGIMWYLKGTSASS